MKPFALLSLVLISTAAWAEEPSNAPTVSNSETALRLIHENLLYLKSGFSAGLYQNGRKIELGFFMGNIDTVFGAFPDALDAARSARAYMITGAVLSGVAFGLLLVDIIWLVMDANSGTVSINNAGYWLLLGGGLVLNLVGGIFTLLGAGKMAEAINRHNFGLFNKQLPANQQIEVNKLVTRERALVTVPLVAMAF
jgi:hypothetical protein